MSKTDEQQLLLAVGRRLWPEMAKQEREAPFTPQGLADKIDAQAAMIAYALIDGYHSQ